VRQTKRTLSARFQCQICSGMYPEARALRRHMCSEHPSEAQQLDISNEHAICGICGYVGRKDNVLRHTKAKHAGSPKL
ncbi:hypothetical protein QBC35DRAFT_396572, partial [Podospora australis]